MENVHTLTLCFHDSGTLVLVHGVLYLYNLYFTFICKIKNFKYSWLPLRLSLLVLYFFLLVIMSYLLYMIVYTSCFVSTPLSIMEKGGEQIEVNFLILCLKFYASRYLFISCV